MPFPSGSKSSTPAMNGDIARSPKRRWHRSRRLCRDLIGRYSIPPHRVVGHSDIAPERKSDPGELFDWARLARAGIGIWPPAKPESRGFAINPAEAIGDLSSIGYCANAEVANARARCFSTPLPTRVLRRPARCRNRRPPLGSEGCLRAIESRGRRRGSHVELQGFLQPLQVNRAVPCACQSERDDKQ